MADGAAAPTEEVQPSITVVLDKASLETVKMKSGQYCLLNCDDHQVSQHHLPDRGHPEYPAVRQNVMILL